MGTSAPENGIYGISGLWDLGIMGFVICGILVLWEKGGEEGRNRERRVGQEPWSISPFHFKLVRTGDQARSLGEITVGRGTGRGRGDLVTIVFPWAFQYAEMIFLLLKLVSWIQKGSS